MNDADCYSVLQEIREELSSCSSLLVSVEGQVHQIYLWVLLFVSVTFAILVLYICFRPFMYFLDRY